MDLVIDDTYIESVKQFLMNQCDALGSLISRYIQTMNSVVEMGFMEGKTAEAVREFLTQVESNVSADNSNPKHMDSKIERLCINFIYEVDKAGKELY